VFAATGAAVLHLATHATPTALGPALALADGPVGVGDIIDRSVAPELVVLASCGSADAQDRTELGALASAFLAAGAHAIVASRWAVADDAAREFSIAFYAADGVHDPIGATAAAQRTLIRRGVPTASWSTFVVYGGRNSTSQGGDRWR
jgi:CHAT domain-containing protein